MKMRDYNELITNGNDVSLPITIQLYDWFQAINYPHRRHPPVSATQQNPAARRSHLRRAFLFPPATK